MEIVSSTTEFDFNSISLADPQPLNGHIGFYFTELVVGDEKKSLCLQLPECSSKQGIVNIKNGKYLDLMFERLNHTDLMSWIEKLEYKCQDIINEKKDLWFQTELTRDDIETMMTQVTRLYQSGKYILMRVFIDSKSGKKCIAYDEQEIGFDLDTLEPNQSIIPLVMFDGVKFSSRSFEISLKLIQVMVIDLTDKKSSCLIKRTYEKKSEVIQNNLAQNEPILNSEEVNSELKDNNIPVAEPVAEPVVEPVVEPVAEPVAEPENNIKFKEDDDISNIEIQKPEVLKIDIKKPQPRPVIKKEQSEMLKNKTIESSKISLNIPEPNSNTLEEININYNDTNDTISLKNPNEVYYQMYQLARERAKSCRTKAIEAYLEAKQIKTKYMLFDIDDDSDSDSENSDEFNEFED